MAQASPKTRQIRRLKTELKYANKIMQVALSQRDEARAMATVLVKALEKANAVLEANNIKVDWEATTDEQGDQTNRPNQDSAGLEVPTV